MFGKERGRQIGRRGEQEERREDEGKKLMREESRRGIADETFFEAFYTEAAIIEQ